MRFNRRATHVTEAVRRFVRTRSCRVGLLAWLGATVGLTGRGWLVGLAVAWVVVRAAGPGAGPRRCAGLGPANG